MKAIFFDCPPFLHALYQGELAAIVPDLEINIGNPSRDAAIALLADAAFAMNDHTKMDEAFLAACPSLRSIVFLGTGAASFIDLAAAERLGIRVRNYSGYGDQSVAEHAVALMFAAARQVATMDRAVRAGQWEALDGIESRRQGFGGGRHRRHRQDDGAAWRRARHAGDRVEQERRAGRPAVRGGRASMRCWPRRTWSRCTSP